MRRLLCEGSDEPWIWAVVRRAEPAGMDVSLYPLPIFLGEPLLPLSALVLRTVNPSGSKRGHLVYFWPVTAKHPPGHRDSFGVDTDVS